LRLTARGRAGHGSRPSLADNANIKMASAFLDLAKLKTAITLDRDVVAAIKMVTRGLFGEQRATKLIKKHLNANGLDALLDKIATEDRQVAETLRSLTRMTISPTVIHGGTETNVIPGTCEGRVDVRLIPGQDSEDAVRTVRRCVRNPDIEVDPYKYTAVSISPSNTPFYEAITSTLTELAPGSVTVPQISSGMSDSRFWRKLGSVVYGCVPLSPNTRASDISPGVHGPNERIDIPSLEFGTKFLISLAQRVLL